MLLILPVLFILGVLTVKGYPALSWEFFTEMPRDGMTAGGILPALIGTLWLVGVALSVAVPLGIAAAIYLSEYAPDNGLTRVINLAIINLAGVPSIVHALFGLGAFVIFLKPMTGGTCILAASLTLAIMTLPVVIVSTRESLQAVPRPFREACWSLGATRWQTIRKVVLPNSISGILTGVIIQVSMTVGETAPIMYTGAVAYVAFLPESFTDETMAMSLHLYNMSFVFQDIPEALPYGVALTLIGVVLALNSASIAFRMYLRGQKKW
jgi:phosphate transport system permease protein